MKIIYKLLILALVPTFFAACSGSERRKADISNIDLDVKIIRFDSLFWNLDIENWEQSYGELKNHYPDMTRTYIENVVRFGGVDSAIVLETYRIFRADTAVQRVYNDALAKYANIDDLNSELTDAFKRAKYFLPHLQTPDLYFHVSGFNQSIVIGSDSLGLSPFVSLSCDNYLGSDYELYEMIGIYDYQRKNMKKVNIAPDYLLTWLYSEYEVTKGASPTLLDEIIYRGKMLYVVEQLLPSYSEAQIMGYDQYDYQWVKENEQAMWNTLIANGDLYETNPITKGRYVNDGPFTLPFTQESPSRGGTWLGLQIVKSFMGHNRSYTIAELMQLNDGQTLLNKSHYKP